MLQHLGRPWPQPKGTSTMASIRIALWEFTRDPALIAFLKRGAHDSDQEPVVAKPPRPRNFTDGNAIRPAFEDVDYDDAAVTLCVHVGRGARFLARELEDA